MDREAEIYIRYEAELAEIAALDRLYYQTVAASRADRADYYRRQDQLGQIRTRLYAELSAEKKKEPKPLKWPTVTVEERS
jgi:hypothetical protein